MSVLWKEFNVSLKTSKYRVINKIPRFVNDNNYTSAFGIQWNHFRTTQLDSFSNFPLSESRLKRCIGKDLFSKLEGKLILEAGCGAGRFTEILLHNGANVASVDMSSAVDANQENFPQNKLKNLR